MPAQLERFKINSKVKSREHGRNTAFLFLHLVPKIKFIQDRLFTHANDLSSSFVSLDAAWM